MSQFDGESLSSGRSVGGERRGELVACVSTVSSESIKGNREGRVARK